MLHPSSETLIGHTVPKLPATEESSLPLEHMSFAHHTMFANTCSLTKYLKSEQRDRNFCPESTSSNSKQSIDTYAKALEPNFWGDTYDCHVPQPLPTDEDPIPETDSLETASLWRLVDMSDRHDVPYQAPSTRSSNRSNSKQRAPQELGSMVPFRPASQVSKILVSNGTARSPVSATPYHPKFRTWVLEPRGITFNRQMTPEMAYAHFGREEPTGTRTQYYTNTRCAPISSLWVEADHDFVESVVENYTDMAGLGMCEAEFASDAKETLLKQDVLRLKPIGETVWKTERRLELVAKPGPDNNKWLPPPLVHYVLPAANDAASDYEFDIRPDCSYWLSLRGFKSRYKGQIKGWAFVLPGEITCPYVTIEFKRDGVDEIPALNQVAAAASVALYNRFLLRSRRLELKRKLWTSKLTKCIRHYGLTLKGRYYIFWYIKPVLTPEFKWAGCKMNAVFEGDCTKPEEVRDLIDWLNEIHCWGLTVHAHKCAQDIKLAMKTTAPRSDIRVSDVHADSDSDLGPDSDDDEGEQGQTKGDV